MIIPLSTDALKVHEGETENRSGYLCMCTMAPSTADNGRLTMYKARLVGEILSSSLTSALLYQKARRDSQTDSLTGAGTRRVLEEQLQAEHERAVRYRRPFCVAVVDVDRFKRINDESGHIAGDRMLKRLTGILRSTIRATDILGRYGGDEFVILMPETELQDAVDAVERARSTAESTLMASGQVVTISCGVAQWSGDEGGADVLRRADRALYDAKNAGRNNVQVARAA